VAEEFEAQRERFREALASGPPLRLAVLFGSRATGRAHAGSDFDVGIIPVDPEMSLHDELALASSLSAAVSAEVDVVRLDEDAPLLGSEVARHGVCLFEAHPGVFAAYQADAMSRYIDFEETIGPHRVVWLRRIGGADR
jgi:predicted nucleotidyltransferase